MSSSIENKRKARQFCLQFFFHYQLPIFKDDASDDLENNDKLIESINDFKNSLSVMFDDEGNGYILRVIQGTLKNYQELIDLISPKLVKWKIDRLPKVDLTILLLATFELKYVKSLDAPIIINEALELAKEYGQKDSGQFINGILDKLAKELR